MTYVQAVSGRGGWPMSVWLTPQLEPFYGGTYYPPQVGRGVKSAINQLKLPAYVRIVAVTVLSSTPSGPLH